MVALEKGAIGRSLEMARDGEEAVVDDLLLSSTTCN